MSKRSRSRPKPIVRFFYGDEEVDLEGFFQAIVACGGLAAATISTEGADGVEAVEPAPRYRLTPKGRVALAPESGAGA